MGQLRQAHCPVGAKPRITIRTTMLPPLVFGFALSAVTVFALAHLAGGAVRSTLGPVPTEALLVVALLALAAIEISFPRLRPTLLRRQTPRALPRYFSLPTTGFLWGLDTGTVFSTFRASVASWGALALAVAGWAPWWAGVVYAAAFCVPLTVLVASYPVAGAPGGARGWRRQSTDSVVVTLLKSLRYFRLVAVAAILAAVTVAVAGAIQ